jgi:hypothetical protein
MRICVCFFATLHYTALQSIFESYSPAPVEAKQQQQQPAASLSAFTQSIPQSSGFDLDALMGGL